MKKLSVNKEACIGCGMCVAIDADHFEFGEDGLSSVISQENIESENVLNAISSCPTGAISTSDGCDNPNCTCDPCTCEDCNCKD